MDVVDLIWDGMGGGEKWIREGRIREGRIREGGDNTYAGDDTACYNLMWHMIYRFFCISHTHHREVRDGKAAE